MKTTNFSGWSLNRQIDKLLCSLRLKRRQIVNDAMFKHFFLQEKVRDWQWKEFKGIRLYEFLPKIDISHSSLTHIIDKQECLLDTTITYHKVSFRGANFSSYHLQRVTLAKCDLREVNFFFADLRGANLSGSNLSNANFTLADLRGANMEGCKTKGTIFTNSLLE